MSNDIKKGMIMSYRSLLLILALLLSLVGCGHEVTCPSNQTKVDGKCQTIRCDKDKNACPSGSYCASDKSCQIHKVVACQKDIDCGSGTCVDQQCVNPEWCHFNRECMPGDSCNPDTSQCQPSPCPDGCRSGGICNNATGICENAPSCTPELESVKCVSGNKCVDLGSGGMKCMTGGDFCNLDPCQRGQCNPRTYACVSAPDCYHNDKNCLPGNFCDGSTCKVSKCSSDKASCTGGRGVCQPDKGECENAPSCTSDNDCLSGYTCIYTLPNTVHGRTGTCMLESATNDYCHPACTGNQTCTNENDAWTCKEPSGICHDSLDCLPGRSCVQKLNWPYPKCAGPLLCTTPHTGTKTAPEFFKRDIQKVELCSGSDYYTYKPVGAKSGDILVLRFSIDPTDVGLADTTLTITTNDAAFQPVTLTIPKDGVGGTTKVTTLTPKDDGSDTYFFEVHTSSGAPIHYSLEKTLLPANVAKACLNAKTIELGKVKRGKLSQTSTTSIVDCNDLTGTSREELWHLHLDESMSVHISVFAGSGFDPQISIRKSCDATSDSIACVNRKPVAVTEKLDQILPAGDYDIVVQGDENDSTEREYAIYVEGEKLVCDIGQHTCTTTSTKSTMLYCPFSRSKLVSQECQNGCDTNTGVCKELVGSSCLFAQPVTTTKPFSGDLHLSDTSNLSLPRNCGTALPRRTKNGEYVFSAFVPSGYLLKASAKNTTTTLHTRYVLYLLDTCDGTGNSCLAGAGAQPAANAQTLEWANDGDAKEVFLVVDSAPDRSYSNQLDDSPEVHVDVELIKLACVPNQFTCENNHLMQCDSDGNAKQQYAACENGCDPTGIAHCRPLTTGDRCDTPIELSTNISSTAYNIHEATDDYDIPIVCKGASLGNKDKQEYVFKGHTDNVGDTITFTVTPDAAFDPVIWSSDQCIANLDTTCLASVDDGRKGDPETLQFIADAPNKDYYFVVSGAGEGEFHVSYQVDTKSPSCVDTNNPSNVLFGHSIGCDDHNTIHYCDINGHLTPYTCDACSKGDASCQTRQGGICEDAILIDATTATIGKENTISGDFSKFQKNDVFHRPTNGEGSCLFESSKTYEASDMVYQVTIPAHTRFFSKLDLWSDDIDAKIYFLKDCHKPDTCLGSRSAGNQIISYVTADQAETIYLVVDAGTPVVKSHKFNLKWWIKSENTRSQSTSCQPDTHICQSASLSYCPTDGGASVDISCPTGSTCNGASCQIDKTTSYDCASPLLLSDNDISQAPLFLTWDSNPIPDSNIAESYCSRMVGKTRFFQIHATAGSTLEVKAGAVSGDRVSIVVLNDCSLHKNSCLAGSDTLPLAEDKENSLRYTFDADGDYLIAVGLEKKNVDSTIYASFSLKGDCSHTQPSCASGVLSYCHQGVTEQYTCKQGCASTTTCNPDDNGNTCFEAKVLSPNDTGTLADETIDSSNTLDFDLPYFAPVNTGAFFTNGAPFSSGACLFKQKPSKKDKYYAISLQKGDHLHVSITDDYNSAILLYLIDGCIKSSCVAIDSNDEGNDDRSFDYVATETKTYYIVVSEVKSPGWGAKTFSLNWKIEHPASGKAVATLDPQSMTCPPLLSQCVTDSGVDKNYICDPSGKHVLTTTCPTGTTCKKGVCELTHYINNTTDKGIDTCDDSSLITVKDSQKIHIDFVKLNNINKSTLFCDKTNLSDPADKSLLLGGSDAFFKVVVPKGKLVDVWMKSVLPDDKIAFASYNTCDITQPCQVGGSYLFQSQNTFEKITSFAGDTSTEKTFYFSIDSFDDTAFPPRAIYFDFRTPECLQVGQQTCDSAAHDLLTCSSLFTYTKYTCSSGTCSSDRCQNPSGNSCEEPIFISYTKGTTWTSSAATFNGRSNTFQTTPSSTMCSGENSPGNDVLYAINLNKGDTLTATLTGSGAGAQQDLALYLTDACTPGTVSACRAASDSAGLDPTTTQHPESFTFTATESKTYYLVVDSYWTNLDSAYTLKVDVQ